MKILASGDIHGDSSLAKRLAEKAEEENVDLVALAGDLTYADRSTENILGHFAKKGKGVLFVPGNHDSLATAGFLSEAYPARNMHGYGIKYDSIGFFGCGGANIGPALNLSDEEMFTLLERSYKYIAGAKKKVMIVHNHPKNSVMEKFSTFTPGSDAIKKAIEKFQPDIVICSHEHTAAGVEEMIGKSKVINVSRQFKIIEL